MTVPRTRTKKVTEVKLSVTDKRVLKSLSEHWEVDASHKKLVGQFDFSRYLDAFMFVTRIAVHAEVQKEYPDIHLTATTVKVTLTNQTSKQVTTTEIAFAKRIESLFLSPQTVRRA